jgi:hypothetical protein
MESRVVVVVPSGCKRLLVILFDFLSQRYRVLLSLSRFRFVVTYFPRPCRSGPSIALFCLAFMVSCQFIVRVIRISFVHFVRCLPHLLLPSVNLNIKSVSNESDVRNMCPKYFNLLITAVSRECLGLI